jgi:hypothetical protein
MSGFMGVARTIIEPGEERVAVEATDMGLIAKLGFLQ